MAEEPSPNGNSTLLPEERLIVLMIARAMAQDLLKLAKLPMRREVLQQVLWILEGVS